MPTLRGDIALMPIGDVFLWVANRKQSVRIELKRGGQSSWFLVREGFVHQASSSDPREYLGQHLINFGYIDEDALQKAFDAQRETRVPLGRVLVMVEALTPDQLSRVLLFKTRESLLEAMSWREGTFRVTTDVDESRDLDGTTPVDLREVHSEGLARERMWEEIRRVFPSDATRCDVLDRPLALSDFDQRLLDTLSRGASIGEISLELRSMDFQIYARLYDLFNRKLIQPRLTTSPRPAPADDHEGADPTGITGGGILQLDATPNPEDATRPLNAESFVHSPRDREGVYLVVKAEQPKEAPGVQIPVEAERPHEAMRIALAGRNWGEALLISERILELDPQDAEAIAARRVADTHVRRLESQNAAEGISIDRVPHLHVDRAQLAQAHLTSKERYVLSRVDGLRTLAQIAAVSPIQKGELLRIIESFVNRGVLRLQ